MIRQPGGVANSSQSLIVPDAVPVENDDVAHEGSEGKVAKSPTSILLTCTYEGRVMHAIKSHTLRFDWI